MPKYYYYYYYYYYYPSLWVFAPALADGFSLDFEWNQVLPDSFQNSGRSQQCFILDGLYLSSYFQVSCLFTNPLEIVTCAPITCGITVTFMFNNFYSSLARSTYLSFFSPSFNFILWSTGLEKSTIQQVLFFLLNITWSGRLTKIRWSVCISKSQRSFCVWFVHITLLRMITFKFLVQFPVVHLSYLVMSSVIFLLC